MCEAPALIPSMAKNKVKIKRVEGGLMEEHMTGICEALGSKPSTKTTTKIAKKQATHYKFEVFSFLLRR
jgi:hypothetical protein